MTSLIRTDHIKDPTWYFKDARWSGGNQCYIFEWPSKQYPYLGFVHYNILQNELKISIREYIEYNLKSPVFYDILDLSYRRYFGERKSWNDSYEVDNRWYRFGFKDKEDLLIFKLKFQSSVVLNPTDYHPEYPEDEEYLKEFKGER